MSLVSLLCPSTINKLKLIRKCGSLLFQWLTLGQQYKALIKLKVFATRKVPLNVCRSVLFPCLRWSQGAGTTTSTVRILRELLPPNNAAYFVVCSLEGPGCQTLPTSKIYGVSQVSGLTEQHHLETGWDWLLLLVIISPHYILLATENLQCLMSPLVFFCFQD